jgi:hypothetical protein
MLKVMQEELLIVAGGHSRQMSINTLMYESRLIVTTSLISASGGTRLVA